MKYWCALLKMLDGSGRASNGGSSVQSCTACLVFFARMRSWHDVAYAGISPPLRLCDPRTHARFRRGYDGGRLGEIAISHEILISRISCDLT